MTYFLSKSFQPDCFVVIAVVQSPSHVQLIASPWTAVCQASLFFTISYSLLKLTSIELEMPSNHPILCHPLLLLPSIFPSIMVFSNELTLHSRWPKYWKISFSICPSKEYSGLISFSITGLISFQSKGLSRIFSSISFPGDAGEGMALYFFCWGRHGHDGLQRLGRKLGGIRQRGSVYQRNIKKREIQADQT